MSARVLSLLAVVLLMACAALSARGSGQPDGCSMLSAADLLAMRGGSTGCDNKGAQQETCTGTNQNQPSSNCPMNSATNGCTLNQTDNKCYNQSQNAFFSCNATKNGYNCATTYTDLCGTYTNGPPDLNGRCFGMCQSLPKTCGEPKTTATETQCQN